MKLKYLPLLALLSVLFFLQTPVPVIAKTQNAAVKQTHDAKSLDLHADAIAYVFRSYNKKLPNERALEYARYVLEASQRYNIDPGLLAAVVIRESTVNPQARSKYAVGLMQIYWKLHKKTIMAQFPHIKTEKILMEPRNNIMVGTWLLSRYVINCNGDTRKALQRYLGVKSDRYVQLVLKYRRQYSERLQFLQRQPSKRSS